MKELVLQGKCKKTGIVHIKAMLVKLHRIY